MKPKIALVTGAGGIIGPSIVQRLIEDGWTVAAADRNLEEFTSGERLLGRPFPGHHFAADLSSRAECERLVAEVEAKLGPISGIVNNAAYNANRLFEDLDETASQREWAINTLAPLWLALAALPSLRAAKGGVVNMSSMQVIRGLRPSLVYSATKAALETVTTQLAGQFLDEGVRFNGIRIGMVPGYAFLRPAAEKLPDDLAAKMVADVLPKHLEAARERNGEQCTGSPEDIAALTAFLLRPEARFINGSIITLDGGLLQAPLGAPFPKNTDRGNRHNLVQQWLEQNVTSHQP